MASLGTISLTGQSRTVYPFNVYKRSTTFQPTGALYVMAKLNENQQYNMFYIGQTGDLSCRPLDHHKTTCFDTHGADTLFIRVEKD